MGCLAIMYGSSFCEAISVEKISPLGLLSPQNYVSQIFVSEAGCPPDTNASNEITKFKIYSDEYSK